MARRTRNDGPDTWHHVMNRAIARRSLFETPEDIRFFLAGVARAVRRGHLEVHAWCVLTTPLPHACAKPARTAFRSHAPTAERQAGRRTPRPATVRHGCVRLGHPVEARLRARPLARSSQP